MKFSGSPVDHGEHETAWVVEQQHLAGLVYWCGFGWSSKHEDALRFARKCDAETMNNKFHLNGVAVEHMWCAPQPSSDHETVKWCTYCGSAEGASVEGCSQNLDENGYGPHNFQPTAPRERLSDTPWMKMKPIPSELGVLDACRDILDLRAALAAMTDERDKALAEPNRVPASDLCTVEELRAKHGLRADHVRVWETYRSTLTIREVETPLCVAEKNARLTAEIETLKGRVTEAASLLFRWDKHIEGVTDSQNLELETRSFLAREVASWPTT